MTAPDSPGSDFDVMRDVYMTRAQREAYERIAALARGPQQAGGEVQRFRPTLQKSGQSPKGYIAVMTAKDDPRDSDWRVEESRAWVRYTDYAALQAEVARLTRESDGYRQSRNAYEEDVVRLQAALREAGRDAVDAKRWRSFRKTRSIRAEGLTPEHWDAREDAQIAAAEADAYDAALNGGQDDH